MMRLLVAVWAASFVALCVYLVMAVRLVAEARAENRRLVLESGSLFHRRLAEYASLYRKWQAVRNEADVWLRVAGDREHQLGDLRGEQTTLLAQLEAARRLLHPKVPDTAQPKKRKRT